MLPAGTDPWWWPSANRKTCERNHDTADAKLCIGLPQTAIATAAAASGKIALQETYVHQDLARRSISELCDARDLAEAF
jgi:hypothetical protein